MKKKILTIIFALVAIISVIYPVQYWYTHKEGITLGLASVFEKLAYPYKLYHLTSLPPDATLLIPITGLTKSQIADTWGEAREAGRTHEGVDIFAPRGEPIFSATEGFVARIGVSTLGGNHVYVTVKGGVRYYYAHLDKVADGIEAGTEVTTDTVLGYVGNTGNASTTPPHLHFGMYQNGAHNPFDLLVTR